MAQLRFLIYVTFNTVFIINIKINPEIDNLVNITNQLVKRNKEILGLMRIKDRKVDLISYDCKSHQCETLFHVVFQIKSLLYGSLYSFSSPAQIGLYDLANCLQCFYFKQRKRFLTKRKYYNRADFLGCTECHFTEQNFPSCFLNESKSFQ